MHVVRNLTFKVHERFSSIKCHQRKRWSLIYDPRKHAAPNDRLCFLKKNHVFNVVTHFLCEVKNNGRAKYTRNHVLLQMILLPVFTLWQAHKFKITLL